MLPSALPAPSPGLLAGSSLFLDFDGTLVEIASHPDGVIVGEALEALLLKIWRALSGRMALISGRPLADLDRLIARERYAIGGSHGLELRWPDGRTQSPAPLMFMAEIVSEMRALQSRHDGLVVEEKPYGAALHYRRAPEAEEECRSLALRLAEREGVSLQTGKMVFEIKPTGKDKGSAVEALMREPPMSGTKPIFIGDDDTDEAAFRSAEALGGAGILVGPLRETSARFHLPDVTATHRWLNDALVALA